MHLCCLLNARGQQSQNTNYKNNEDFSVHVSLLAFESFAAWVEDVVGVSGTLVHEHRVDPNE